ncbi:hypothetical protein PV326_007068 [Microctonus aethiopoides]|nr:hypothetical protein PV326_007068 [Microctonus aethiopoides]
MEIMKLKPIIELIHENVEIYGRNKQEKKEENPEWNVLLIEAGSHETEITDVPAFSFFLHKSKVDWKYRPHYSGLPVWQ